MHAYTGVQELNLSNPSKFQCVLCNSDIKSKRILSIFDKKGKKFLS